MNFFDAIGSILGIYFGYTAYGIGGAFLGGIVGGILARVAVINLVTFAPIIGVIFIIWAIASLWNVG